MRKLPLLIIVPLLMISFVSCDLFNNDNTTVYNLTTTTTPAEGGTISPGDGEFEEGEEVELTAEAADGYNFSHWEGDHPGEANPATFTFDSHKEMIAVFTLKEYTLGIEVEGEGSVDENVIEQAAKTEYGHGTVVELVPNAAHGWDFVEWQGDLTGNENPAYITVEDEKNVTAVFALEEYEIAVNVEGEGSVSVEPDKDIYQFGDEVTLITEPVESWRFLEWQGDLSGEETTAVIDALDGNKDITAIFVPVEDPLWAMGYNHNGQLGAGSQIEHHDPVRNIYNVDKVRAGAFHSLYIKTDGTLWGMGFNNYGQIGNGTDEDQHKPIQIETDVTDIAAGEHHSLFIKSDGTLWAMGENADGQLGDGTNTDRLTPVQIDSDVIAVAAGAWHSIYVKTDGTLWAMGRNNFGQLGDGTNENKSTPVQIDSDVEKVAAGKRHSLFVKGNGDLFGMGRNAAGQLGIGTEGGLPIADPNNPVLIDTQVDTMAGGTDHTLYIKDDGSLWTMGNNEYGQLGDGSNTTRESPVQIADDAIAVAAGNRHSLYISSNGTLWAMGFNGNGQLGDGTVNNHSTPIQVDTEVNGIGAGINHSLYIKD